MRNTDLNGTPGTFQCSQCELAWQTSPSGGSGPGLVRYCPSCGGFNTITFAPDPVDPTEHDIPVSTDEIIGWRAWKIAELGKLVRLQSVTHSDHIWPARDWIYAECAGSRHCHKALDGRIPGDNCSCGLYAARSYKHLTRDLSYADYDNREVRIIGQVAMAGDVIEGSQGWKAEKARVFHLYVPHTHWKLGQRLSRQYGVPYDTHRWI